MATMQPTPQPASTVGRAGPPLIGWRAEPGGDITVILSGEWSVAKGVPEAVALRSLLTLANNCALVRLDARGLSRWDSTLPVFVLRLMTQCRAQGIELDTTGLPTAARALLTQANAGTVVDTAEGQARKGMSAEAGEWAIGGGRELLAQLEFIGRVAIALAAVARGAGRFRFGDFILLAHQCGPGAVPIVTLISLLVGMILAFVGAVQLRMFGAQLYIADLVGLGMAREMSAMMTAVLLAGRTGAAYAAELGSMRVNEELDAMHTVGLNPLEFLVVPRILALTLVTPLLCIYADCMGILGGALVTVGLFDISMQEYFNESRVWLDMTDFNIGIAKSAVFGLLVATGGCMRGMRCGSNSSDVGYAATNAVVTSIVWVVVADAILTLIIATLDI